MVTGFVGKPITWDRHKTINEKCMDIEQLREMISDGWELASHGITHQNFALITRDLIVEELRESKAWITDNLKVEPVCFVLPYGSLPIVMKSREFVALVKKYYPYLRRNSKTSYSVFHGLKNNDKEYRKLLWLVNGIKV